MKRVTTPYGAQKVAPFGVVSLASAFDLFTLLAVFGSVIQVIELWGLARPDSWWNGAAALVSFLYVFLAHRGIIFGVGSWCLGLERYKYQDIEEFEGEGVLFVLSAHSHTSRFKRVTIVLAAVGILMLVATNL